MIIHIKYYTLVAVFLWYNYAMGYENLEKLIEVVKKLRSPEGCQWDRAQTHKSLRPNMLEEAYEAVDAMDSGDMKHLKEELGDVLLQVILHAQIAADENEFTIEDVAGGLTDKLIHRHPHVFGNVKVNSTQDIIDNWDKLKQEEKKHRKSAMDGISKSQSALMSAQKISKKAVKCGFEWPDEKSLYKCIYSEFEEFKQAVKTQNKENMEEYHKLYSFLFKSFPNVVLNVYPGFVKKSYGLCAYSERNLLSNEEQAQFVLSQYKNYHIMDNTHFLPTTSYTECLARCLNGFLVSPDGYLYKCWTDLGNKEESVGHISNEEYRIDNLSKYMVGGDPFSDEKCRKCKFLPICGGGCPHMRLKNIFKDAKIDLCHISKNHIHEFLELYYERHIENRN